MSAKQPPRDDVFPPVSIDSFHQLHNPDDDPVPNPVVDVSPVTIPDQLPGMKPANKKEA